MTDLTRAPQFAMPVYVVGGSGQFPPTGQAFLGYQKLALSGSPQSLTVPVGALSAYVATEGGNARWGTATQTPTLDGDHGQLLWGTAAMTVAGTLLTAVEYVNMTGSTTILDITYFG